MFDKLENVEKRYEELNKKIADPEIIANQNEWKKLMKEHADITPIVEKYREYKNAQASEAELKEKFSDWEIQKFTPTEIVLYKELNEFCFLSEETVIIFE